MTAFCVWTLISLGTIALGAWLYQQNFVVPPEYKIKPSDHGRTLVIYAPDGDEVVIIGWFDTWTDSISARYRAATRAANKHYRYTYQREDVK